MSQGKKYDFSVMQDDKGWTAGIIRKVSARRTVVSKSKDGFATEAEAVAWAEETLKGFLDGQTQRNKRRDERREIRREQEAEAAAARAAAIAAAEAARAEAAEDDDFDYDDEDDIVEE